MQELESGAYDFVSRSDRTTLVAGTGKVKRPKLIGAIEAQSELDNILDGFFEDLAEGANPRAAIRLTMGAGKTKNHNPSKDLSSGQIPSEDRSLCSSP